jgi:hypothetical protein
MGETDQKNKITIKPKIIACLLENEVANTGAIADYCYPGEVKKNKYRYVTRPLDKLVTEDFIKAIEKYRPEVSRWRLGTGYTLTRDFIIISKIYFDPDYAEVQHKFLESEWLCELIIDNQMLPGKEKNKEILHRMLEISPTFFQFCLLNTITPDTFRSWKTPVNNIGWLYRRFSENIPLDTLSRDIKFLELFRFCLFQDWAKTYPDGQIPPDLQHLLNGIKAIEEQEYGRIMDTIMAFHTVESIRCFDMFNFVREADKKQNLHDLVIDFGRNLGSFAETERDKQKIMVAKIKAQAREISEIIRLDDKKRQKESPEHTYAFLDQYLEKRNLSRN